MIDLHTDKIHVVCTCQDYQSRQLFIIQFQEITQIQEVISQLLPKLIGHAPSSMLPYTPMHLLDTQLETPRDHYQKYIHKVPHECHGQCGPFYEEGLDPIELKNGEKLLPLTLKVIQPKVHIQFALVYLLIVAINGTAYIRGMLTECSHQETHAPQTHLTSKLPAKTAIIARLLKYQFTACGLPNQMRPAYGEGKKDAKPGNANDAKAEGTCRRRR